MNSISVAWLGRAARAIALACAVHGAAIAGPREDAQAAFDRGDHAAAFALWQPLAEQGDAAARYGIGLVLLAGRAQPRDVPQALRWIRLAAEQGHALAENRLGFLYQHGIGVPRDEADAADAADAEAARWYARAAAQGLAVAQSNLGYLYLRGVGVDPDAQQALRLFLRAAEQGEPTAQSALGEMYKLGRGVPQDPVQAYMWLTIAAASFGPGPDRDEAIDYRDAFVAPEMTPAQIAEAERRARAWADAHPGQRR